MQIKGLFGGVLPLIEKNLDLRSQNHKAIVSNIANADTPNYRAFDLHVHDALKKDLQEGGKVPLLRTASAHMDGARLRDATAFLGQARVEPYTLRLDGNTVDVDKEMGELADNQLMYHTCAEILNKKLQGIKAVIQGGK